MQLTECHLAIDDLTTELVREKEHFAQEKEEMERRLAEVSGQHRESLHRNTGFQFHH